MDNLEPRIVGRLADGGVKCGWSWICGDKQDGRTCAAEANPNNGRVFCQWQKQRQKRTGLQAVGLVDSVLHCGAKKIPSSLEEGSDEKCRALDVGDGVTLRISSRKHGARFGGRQASGRQS